MDAAPFVVTQPEDSPLSQRPLYHGYGIAVKLTARIVFHAGSGATLEMREFGASVLAERIRLASGSCWLRLARKLGVGPKFE